MSTPIPVKQRIQYLDVVRGFAISGVLIAYVFWNLGTAPESTWTSFDFGLNKALTFVIDSKCFTLLANLFAVGFVLHMNKSENKARSLYTYRRRLVGLMIIGAVHALLLRNGDILLPYALLMMVASFFYAASNRTVIIAMVITFLLPSFMSNIWKLFGWSFPGRPTISGSYLVENFEWVKYWYRTAPFFWETTLVFLLSGLLIGRAFIEKKIRLTTTQLVVIIFSGLMLGVASNYVINNYIAAIGNLPDIGQTYILRKTIFNILLISHQAGLAAAYASIIYLLVKKISLRGIAAMGRTSLTNYVLQAAIVIPICIAFNLFDHITPTGALIMTAAIWIFQFIFSQWWLRRFQFGPLEWVLRRFTYGKLVSTKEQKTELELSMS